MKKIFTMILGLAFTAAAFAADRKPDVTIISMKKYEIVIDGKTYLSNNKMMEIQNLRSGRHMIKVYEVNKGFSVFKRKQLVSSRSFQLRNNDLKITIDRFGQLNFTEDKFGRDGRFGNDDMFGKDNKGWDDRNDRDGRNDRNDRDRKF
jgi:hypothetical protein